MPPLSRNHLRSVALLTLLAVAGCDSAEERAQGHHDRAVALLEKGDVERASLEFRNALQADPKHLPSLRRYASMLRKEGDVPGAIREYSRLLALRPDDAAVHLALSDLALGTQDYSSVEAHVEQAYALAPEELGARAAMATVAFRRGETERSVQLARGVLEEDRANVSAHMVLISDRLTASRSAEAIALANAALALVPESADLHLARLAALEQAGDAEAVGDQLKQMNALFPEDGMILDRLMQWHIARGENEDAIGVMRRIAERAPEDPAKYLGVVEAILSTKGPAAARAELATLVASQPDATPYHLMLAKLDFSEGRRREAISALENLVEANPSGDVRVALAGMLQATGRAEEARDLVEAVLAADSNHVDALKIRARRLINEDRTEDALADLRTASAEAPRDPEVMTLMAMAHEREGVAALAGERLARAVEASKFGFAETLRYARHLIREERYPEAEGVVLDALRRNPENPDLLVALGQVHLHRKDAARTRQVAGILRGLGTPEAAEAALELEIAALDGADRTVETVALLESIAETEGADMGTRASLVRARLDAGDLQGARADVDAILAENARSVPGRMMLAGFHLLEGRLSEAEPIYRAVMEDSPELAEPYRLLHALLSHLGRSGEALAVLEKGLRATSRSSVLLNTKAERHLALGEHDPAITLYEEVYARDTSNLVVANNLASLLSTYRDDPTSLECAFIVARRLRGTDVPHFQDTYGWILLRRGDKEQALTYLEPAAAALADDPAVQYRLGMAYLALERREEAETSLARAVELGRNQPDLPQVAAARDRLKHLASAKAGG